MSVELSGHYGYRRIIRTMIPMILMMVVISVYSIVDGFFISNWAGSDAFAGMNLIWPPIALVSALGVMFGTGGSALVSKTLGEGDSEKACRIFTMLIRLCFITGVVIGIVIFVAMPWLAKILGADEFMMPHAILYGRIVIPVLPFYMLQMAFQPFFMTAERPHFGTYVSLACGLTNILLDFLFVAVFNWGLAGAAIATSASFCIGGGIPLCFFVSKKNHTHLRFVKTGNDWRAIAKSCSNGLSEFVGSIALNVISICYNLQLMKYIGADGVSAYGIIMYAGFINAAVFIGFNMGISQVIAYNYGAGNRDELKSLLRKCLSIITVCGFLILIASESCAGIVADLFVGYDAEQAALTRRAIRIYMISSIFFGYNLFASAWFTALNNGIVSSVAAFVRTLGFELASVFILPAFFGVDGIWNAVNVAEGLCMFLSFALIALYAKRYGYSSFARRRAHLPSAVSPRKVNS